MTVALLSKWGNQPAGTLYTTDAITEAAMITAKVATATLTGASTWIPPGNSPGVSGTPVNGFSDPVTGGISLSIENSGIGAATVIGRALFDVVKGQGTPTYIGTEQASSGNFGRNLIEYTGDAVSGTPSLRAVAQYTNFKTSAGVALSSGGANTSLHGAKVLSDGAVMFHVYNGDTKLNYLYLTNTTRTSFGSDAGRTNGNAVVDIGSRGGTHYANIRTTHARSLGETVNRAGVRHVWLVEYNVGTGRTSGSANDFVRVLQSADGGLTWTTFIEMNTTVSQHYADHLHGIVQNPYTGMIYFMAGDDKDGGYDERWILAWDGLSAAPALGSGPDTFAATAGWKVLQGTELYRTVDMLFSPTTAYWLCDCDTQAADATSDAFAAMVADPALQWASRVESIERIDNLPPAIGVRTTSGLSVFASFHNANPAANEYWIWTSGNDGKNWKLAAKLRGYATNSAIGVQWNLFEDPYSGKALMSGGIAKGVQWLASATSGYTYVLDVSRNISSVQTFG